MKSNAAAAEDSPCLQHHLHPRQLSNPLVSSAAGAAPLTVAFLGHPLALGEVKGSHKGPLPPSHHQGHFSVSAENCKHGTMVQVLSPAEKLAEGFTFLHIAVATKKSLD